MTSRERMKKAMALEEADRVPVMCQMSIGHMLLQTGCSPSEFWLSADLFAESLLYLRQIYRFDGILVSLHGHSSGWEKSIKRIQTAENGETVTWKNGDRTFFPLDDIPIHYPAEEITLPSVKEFDPESIPEEIPFIPVSQGIKFPISREHPYAIFDILSKRSAGSYSIHGEVTSPFDYFLHLFGYKEALISLIEDPSKSKEILQRLTGGIKKIAVEQAHHNVHAIKISSPYAGSGFISPAFYRKFVLPYEGEIAKSVRASGIPVYTHTCGSISDRLELMVEAGISGLECLDPPPLGDVSLAEAKERIGKKVFIKGNIDPVHVLLNGNREKVIEDAKNHINWGKPGGGFILSTACSIAPHTSRENIQVLTEIAEKYGRY